MDWHDDDYDFYEPHGYEDHIEALVNEVRKNIKAEVVTELDKLRAENEHLQDVKQRIEEIEHEHRQKLYELDQAKRDALNIVRREKLQQIGEALELVVYAPYSYTELGEKCNECDERRYIKFQSPGGNTLTEPCKCSQGHRKYRVKEYVCVEFVSNDGRLRAWYKPSDYKDSDHNVSSDYMEHIFDDVPYEEVKTYRPFFRNKDKCQAYCDWKTEQERIKEGLA